MSGFDKLVVAAVGAFLLYAIFGPRENAPRAGWRSPSGAGQPDFEAEIRRIAPQALGDLRPAAGPLDNALTVPLGAGSYGGYGGYSGYSSGGGSSDDLASAKSDFESAADDLRSAVRGLNYNDWSSQMGTIRGRLSDAEDALSELEDKNPDDPAVQAARDEVDSMQRHVSRLSYENWRDVAPDLERSSRNIEDEAYATSDESDSDEE